jgi:tetratricopeptide (TPR) repeat protein
MLEAYRGAWLNARILDAAPTPGPALKLIKIAAGDDAVAGRPSAVAPSPDPAAVGGPALPTAPDALWQLFQELRAESRREGEAGRLEAALACAGRACEVAGRLNDEEAVALATCNRAAIAIMLGRLEQIADVRNVLMRNFNVTTSFIAAYNLSHAYEIKKEFKKALFYAKIARDRAEESGREDYLVNSHNQIGNSLLGDSFFHEAAAEYERALTLLPAESSVGYVAPTANRAYCMLVQGRRREAFGSLFRSLRWLRRQGFRLYEAWLHVFLCYGYLEAGRLRRAWLHGRKAQAIAERTGEYDAIKSALFLLAEVEKEAGDTAAAHELLTDLQRRFYPQGHELTELMSRVGMRSFVNLRA